MVTYGGDDDDDGVKTMLFKINMGIEARKIGYDRGNKNCADIWCVTLHFADTYPSH